MTIQEVLEADWNVDRIEVTVRTQDGGFVTAYIIGPDVKPLKYHRYQCETKAGDIYKRDGLKYVYIDRVIQFKQSDKNFRSPVRPAGVMLDTIPTELLGLNVSNMCPYCCGRSDNMHGYRFTCLHDLWLGITGEEEMP